MASDGRTAIPDHLVPLIHRSDPEMSVGHWLVMDEYRTEDPETGLMPPQRNYPVSRRSRAWRPLERPLETFDPDRVGHELQPGQAFHASFFISSMSFIQAHRALILDRLRHFLLYRARVPCAECARQSTSTGVHTSCVWLTAGLDPRNPRCVNCMTDPGRACTPLLGQTREQRNREAIHETDIMVRLRTVCTFERFHDLRGNRPSDVYEALRDRENGPLN